jgi:hypothetical protein
MNIDDAFKVAKTGILALLSGTLIFLALHLINYIAGVFTDFNNKRKKTKHDKSALNRNKLDIQIHDIIENVLSITGAKRVCIMEFRKKGVKYAKGQYMTCAYEAREDGAKPASAALKNLSVERYKDFLDNLKSSEYLIGGDPEISPRLKGRRNSANFASFETRWEKKAMCVPIKTLEDLTIGYISLKKDEDFSKNDISIALEAARRLSVLIYRAAA